jgi:HEAT repeat protein
MNSRNKRLIFVTALVLLAFLAVLRWRPGSKSEPPQLVPSQKSALASVNKPLIAASPQKMLRYDEGNDPRLNKDAATRYYQRREQMIRAYHGDAQIDNILNGLRSGNDLLKWLGRVQSHEVVSALPIVADLLDSDNKSVRRVAAETLCWFGDKRGFDFILEQRRKADGLEWSSLLQKVFAEHQPRGYNEALATLMRAKNGEKTSQKVDAYTIAEVLAAMGDASSLEVILPVLTRYPPESADAVLALRNVNDPKVMQLAKELLQNGASPRVKQAAEIILAAHGDDAARRSIIATVNRLAELPQPRNPDGTYKPGMEPASIGAANAAWDGDAVLALEHGIESVPSAQAVPVLQHIAMNANNIRFSETAIQVLAKIGDETAREALWQTARALQTGQRGFESTIYTAAGKALMLFSDATSLEFARQLFAADKHGMEASQLFAESKGWDGLFKQGLFY